MNDKGVGGLPPLQAAIAKGHMHCTKFLLSLGADPNDPDLMHNTALHAAVSASSARFESGARKEVEDAAITEMIHLLLEAGTDRNLVNKKGETALRAALGQKNLTAALALGSGGGSIEALFTAKSIMSQESIFANLAKSDDD